MSECTQLQGTVQCPFNMKQGSPMVDPRTAFIMQGMRQMTENRGHKNIRPIQSGDLSNEELHKRAVNGGKKSGEVRRAKRDAKQAMRYLLELEPNERFTKNLEEMGYPASEQTNLAALNARLFTLAMNGNMDAYDRILKIAGYEPEENRKERESLASDRRREIELEAKVSALENNRDRAKAAISMGSEDGGSDVIIYLPELDNAEEEEDEGFEETGISNQDGDNGGDANAAGT